MKEALILLADTHINSKLGLSAPAVIDDDGNVVQQNIIQKWLWDTWLRFTEDVKDLVKKTYTSVIFDGDMVDIDAKNRSGQMVSRNPVTILASASMVLKPITDLADQIFFIRGTEAHTGNSGWLEELLAQHYNKTVPDEITGNYSWNHLRAEFSGVKLDIAHHMSMGNLPWTYPNAMARVVQETRLNYLEWQEQPPDIVVRAHRHQHVDTGTTFSTRGVALPCWQWLTTYLYRLGKENAKPHIGGSVLICDNGNYQYMPFIYQPRRTPVWKKMH